MQAELLCCQDPRWGEFLGAGRHDFYHLPAYVDLCARRDGGEPVAFWAAEGGAAMLIPMVLRPLPPELEPDPGWRDAATPYGYPCPLLRGDPDEAAVAAMLQAFRDTGAAAGIVTAFLRLHPLLPLLPTAEAPFQAFGALVQHGETVYLDLNQGREELDRQTRVNHLADVRRLEREGYRVLLDGWDRLDDFVAIYQQTMRYRSADAFYCFEPGYFVDLRRCLGERLHLSLVQDPDGAAAAAGLFTWTDGLVQFHLSGTSEAHRRAGPAKLMLIHMRDWARERGARYLHLGGGVGCRQDSLAFFKQGFSKLRAPFSTLRMVLHPERYQALLGRRGRSGSSDFFPGYRQP
ncbi:MAG: GNAT family N-acetyltransferase [Holophaga sp.]|nr:GNAT family N-acetyltransferase [Holophaga sp.]